VLRKLFALFILTVCLGYAGINHSAAAAAPQQPKGITVSPAFSQVKISETEPEHPLQFKITNNEQEAISLNISSADFNTLSESGGLVFVGTNPTALQKKYGLADWIRLMETSITIEPKQTKTVNILILNEPSLNPGGHYGAILFSIDKGDSRPTQNKVAINPIASSLLFVTKSGGDTYRLKLTDVGDNHSIFKLPDSVQLRFKNDGNTHLTPRGTVSVSDSSGRFLSRGIINPDSSIILPENYRRFSVTLNKVSTATKPGKYKLTVNFRFDGYDQYRVYRSSMLVLTTSTLLVILAAALVCIAACLFVVTKNPRLRKYFSKAKKHLKRK